MTIATFFIKIALEMCNLVDKFVFFKNQFLVNWPTWQMKYFTEKNLQVKSVELKLGFQKMKLRTAVVG